MKARVADFFEPAALFLPQGNDWRLTLVGVSFFVCFLTVVRVSQSVISFLALRNVLATGTLSPQATIRGTSLRMGFS